MPQYVLALDQGTTSSRAILFDHSGDMVAVAQEEFPQLLPAPGIVEHDPEAIWQSQLDVARQVLQQASVTADQLAAVGITNQRETIVLWERDTGRPVHNAVVWQSRVSANVCRQLAAAGLGDLFRAKTGLLLDPYFSGTKVKYLLDQDPSLRKRAERGEILFGTVDSFLIWRLTRERLHLTDVSNACRTLMFNIHTRQWDDELLAQLGVPPSMLPQVVPSCGVVGQTDPDLLGSAVPIAGIAGDQQAATFGQACFTPGAAKNTYGTGSFLLLNTGPQPVQSSNNLLTTIGWQIGDEVTYCLEGSVFVAGAVVQWLRDGLGLIRSSGDIEALATTVPDSGGVVFVPAFVGLGAPHWDPHARGTILGLTRGTNAGHVARAALESMAFQTRDLLVAMQADTSVPFTSLNVDGGAAVNNTLLQFQADVLGVPVRRPVVAETTALGAAYLAGLAVGYWSQLAELAAHWELEHEFTPAIDDDHRRTVCARWARAVSRAQQWEEADT